MSNGDPRVVVRVGDPSDVPAAVDEAFKVSEKSGLILPAHVEDRAIEQWPRDDMKVVTRAMRLLASHGIGIVFACNECEEVIQLERRADGPRDVIEWTCKHKIRRVYVPPGKRAAIDGSRDQNGQDQDAED